MDCSSRRWCWGHALALVSALAACRAGSTQESTTTEPWVSAQCAAPPRVRTDARVRLERVFERVEVPGGVSLVRQPGDGARWYAVTKGGVVWTFENTPQARPSVFLDLSSVVVDEGEAGLLDLEFHPA